MSGYTDPITIVLKFRRGLNATMQDKIAESGTDQLRDNDHQGWYAAAHRFDLNRLANEAFRYTSRHPTVQSTMPRYANSTPARTPFSFSHPATLLTLSSASTHAPMRPYPPALSSHPQECGWHQYTKTCHTDLLPMQPDWPHQPEL
jgi:hypothetical protein